MTHYLTKKEVLCYSQTLLSYILLFSLAFIFLYPFLFALTTSFKSLTEIATHPTQLMPNQFSLQGYEWVSNLNIGLWAVNSTMIAMGITLGNVVFASMSGYALARLQFPGAKLMFLAVLSIIMMPPIALIIPRFIIFKQLGWLESFMGLIIPMLITPFSIFLMKEFFTTIPTELEESAYLDGANRFEIFWYVALPMAQPVLVTLIILTFQSSWNEFLHPLIVVNINKDLYTLPLGLALLRGNMGSTLQFNAMLAGVVLTTLPMAIIFIFFQRFFIKGISYSDSYS